MPNLVLRAAVLVLTVKLATGCGGYLVGSGNITSPNYPNQYPMNIRCTWTLTASADHEVLLRLVTLDTAYYDYIYVYKGIVEENTFPSRSLHFYSGQLNDSGSYNVNTKPILVGPTATVMFVSRSSMTASGFHMAFTSVNVTHYTDCGGDLYGSGIITSPNYPLPYPSNCRCLWTLTANPGKLISLRIITLNTESVFDYVLVFNDTRRINTSFNDYAFENSIQRYDGERYFDGWKPIPTAPNAAILFFSDSIISAGGFRIEYSSVDLTPYTGCGGDLFDEGNITSPNYPMPYPLNCRCLWTLTASPGKFILLRILDVNTESKWSDYVLVFNHTIASNTSLKNYSMLYGGQNYDDTGSFYYITKLLLTAPTATIFFVSDFSISAPGFAIEYTSVNVTPFAGCGGDLFGSGNITSPNYPRPYPSNSRCLWTLTANPGKVVSLRFVTLDVESEFDYVYISKGKRTSNFSIYDYTHYYSTKNYVASMFLWPWSSIVYGPTATILFTSDSSIVASGFQIEYTSVDFTPYTDCGGDHFGDGNITSPNYPRPYPLNSRCSWTLTPNPGKFMSLRIIIIDTEKYYDLVYIFNSTESGDSVLYQRYVYSGRQYYSDWNTDLKVLLTGPSSTISFNSDSSISASGFQIEYTSVDLTPFTDCGGSLFNAGNVTSPNYPRPYPMNCLCSWTLNANPGQFISLRIIKVDTEPSRDIVYVFNGTRMINSSLIDYLYLYSGEEPYSRLFNNSSRPILTGPSATIVFISDYSISTAGFQIEYASVDVTPLPGESIASSITAAVGPRSTPSMITTNISIAPTDPTAAVGTATSSLTSDDISVTTTGNPSELTPTTATSTVVDHENTTSVTGFLTAATIIPEGAVTTTDATAAAANINATATVRSGTTDSLATITTAAAAAATNTSSEPPVSTLRRCKPRRNTTVSALPIV